MSLGNDATLADEDTKEGVKVSWQDEQVLSQPGEEKACDGLWFLPHQRTWLDSWRPPSSSPSFSLTCSNHYHQHVFLTWICPNANNMTMTMPPKTACPILSIFEEGPIYLLWISYFPSFNLWNRSKVRCGKQQTQFTTCILCFKKSTRTALRQKYIIWYKGFYLEVVLTFLDEGK